MNKYRRMKIKICLLDLALFFAQTVHLCVEGPELNKNVEVKHSSVHMKQSIVIFIGLCVPCASGDGFMSKRNNVQKLVAKSTKFRSSSKSGHTTFYWIRFLFLEHSRQHFRTKQTPNFSVEWLALLIFIREVSSLNLGSKTCYSEGYRGFRQGSDLTLDQDRFLSQPQLVIH
jgi:hypothetical protein